MSKRMSKTLAAELAERTLAIVNPSNRTIALNEALKRRGFEPVRIAAAELPTDKAALALWLMARFPGE
ncbi:hypothetical protein [Devosia sp.]|uniref:hypothetical protein n=1 Tax=Devosia sp. TaxID=1871048 RepID=UPI001AD36E7F|nr:hypothetical protein [Devosia sp.]MBN9308100.1 hypothetical protein [Devosia sp.]